MATIRDERKVNIIVNGVTVKFPFVDMFTRDVPENLVTLRDLLLERLAVMKALRGGPRRLKHMVHYGNALAAAELMRMARLDMFNIVSVHRNRDRLTVVFSTETSLPTNMHVGATGDFTDIPGANSASVQDVSDSFGITYKLGTDEPTTKTTNLVSVTFYDGKVVNFFTLLDGLAPKAPFMVPFWRILTLALSLSGYIEEVFPAKPWDFLPLREGEKDTDPDYLARVAAAKYEKLLDTCRKGLQAWAPFPATMVVTPTAEDETADLSEFAGLFHAWLLTIPDRTDIEGLDLLRSFFEV